MIKLHVLLILLMMIIMEDDDYDDDDNDVDGDGAFMIMNITRYALF